jgi:hypothetical protein
MKLRALALGLGLLAASVPSLSSSAEAAPWDWHGGWHGDWGGGWGWGGCRAAGAILSRALAAPYFDNDYDYGFDHTYGSGYGPYAGPGYYYAPPCPPYVRPQYRNYRRYGR